MLKDQKYLLAAGVMLLMVCVGAPLALAVPASPESVAQLPADPLSPLLPASPQPALTNLSTGGASTTGPVSSSKPPIDNTIPIPPSPASFNVGAGQVTAQAEQAALQAEAQAEADKQRKDEEHNHKSFERAAGGMLPLAPDQVRELMRRLEATEEASVPPTSGIPKGEVRITTLSLDPGAAPPQINLQSGYVTTINIMDATGEPWPILDVGVGGNFEVSPTKSGSHIVRVMPLSAVTAGNLSILLKELPTPIIFKLVSGTHDVDMRYDARIPKYGPGAKIPIISRPRLEAGNESMMMLLQNAPPADAKRLKISGLDSRSMAWMLGDNVFVRTPLTLLSPAWDASVSSEDGMTVYQIGDAPILLMSDNGALVRARLLRDEDHDR